MSRFQKDDAYFRRAKREGFAARSIYKLEEIDRKHRLFRKGLRVLDLGCAPGSWLQYIARRIGPEGVAVGVDLSEVKISLPPWVTVFQDDMYHMDLETIRAVVTRFDLVVSDAAPSTTGVAWADHARSVELARRSFELARELLRPGGTWVAKVFQGEDLPAFRTDASRAFKKLAQTKPKSSRDRSVEIFLVGLGLKGGKDRPERSSEE